jgi:solute carrier family 34 (sodium-dependent phosphate cotransporter)
VCPKTGQIANVIKKVINANIPYVPWVTGYLALLVGAIMTFLVQSSSVFTSALTPLVGVGVITIERVYPLTLGSNIGTTTTSLIAAMAADAKNLQYTLQISLCHLLFNLTGILLFYPIPFLRFPIPMAKFLGETTSKYRWFSIAYLIGMFFLLPAIIFGLSVAGNVALLVVLIPMSVMLFVVFVICVMQRKKPSWLPVVLRNWKFLPLWMRSLEPVDRIISRLACTSYCTSCQDAKDVEGDEKATITMKPLTRSTSDVPLQYVNGYENGQIVSGISNPSYDRNE